MPHLAFSLGGLLSIILFLMGVALVAAVVLVAWVLLKVRRINLPAAADFFEALRYTPLSVVVMLDVLDFALDIFSAPLAWLILDRLNLKPLRWITVIEAFIPFSDFLPTMTLAWLLARALPKLKVSDNAPQFLKTLTGKTPAYGRPMLTSR